MTLAQGAGPDRQQSRASTAPSRFAAMAARMNTQHQGVGHVEQNFQESSSGYYCDSLRGGAGAAGQGSCVVCFLEEGRSGGLPFDAALACAREHGARVLAFYVVERDLAHYGHMDHLATACDRAAFADYVRQQDMERAHEGFAPLLGGLGGIPCTLDILYGREAIAGRLEAVCSEAERTFVFMREKRKRQK